MRVRKNPVEVEAIQFIKIEGSVLTFAENSDWLMNAIGTPAGQEGSIWAEGNYAMIGTLESPHEASVGDWIMRGVKGELYPCKPDIFEISYTRIE